MTEMTFLQFTDLMLATETGYTVTADITSADGKQKYPVRFEHGHAFGKDIILIESGSNMLVASIGDDVYAAAAELNSIFKWMHPEVDGILLPGEPDDDEIARAIRSGLVAEDGFYTGDNGRLTYDLDAAWDDRLPDEKIQDICDARFPGDMLHDMVDEMYDAPMGEWIGNAKAHAWAVLGYRMEYSGETDEHIEEIAWEIVADAAVNLPVKHFLDQPVLADIFIDTGDANYEYTLNNVYPAYGGIKGEPINEKAAICWLAGTQGYSKEELEAELDKGDIDSPGTFIETLRAEVANSCSPVNGLVILAGMSLKDLIKLNERIRKTFAQSGEKIYEAAARPDEGTICVSKDVKLGLYNTWDGGGSLLDIKLDKGFELPVRYIDRAVPDPTCGGYNIMKTYDIPATCWNIDKEPVSVG